MDTLLLFCLCDFHHNLMMKVALIIFTAFTFSKQIIACLNLAGNFDLEHFLMCALKIKLIGIGDTSSSFHLGKLKGNQCIYSSGEMDPKNHHQRSTQTFLRMTMMTLVMMKMFKEVQRCVSFASLNPKYSQQLSNLSKIEE